jgi:hypothetical protein
LIACSQSVGALCPGHVVWEITMDEFTAAKQRRARRRTMKQQRDHHRTGTQFTRTVQPYVRVRKHRTDNPVMKED